MPTTVVNGVPTWWAEHGAGETVAVLHPGGVDSRALDPTVSGLADAFRVLTPDRRGHGRTPDVDGPVTYALMAEDTAAFLEDVVGGPAHVVGVSDGAVVALLLALHRPELVRRLVLVSGVHHRDGWDPATEETDEGMSGFLAQLHDEVSPDAPGHYPAVAARLAAEHAREPRLATSDLGRVRARTLVMVADDDEVRPEHALATYRSIPEAELAVVPGTSHGLLVEKPELCNLLIRSFLAEDPVPTLAPIRRAPTAQ
ncbi:alpha/beta fold hydrolase [Kocuria sp. M1N1S27]|uniref:alpha/beta fold hydrolase n=1 Tax=Kocuria kalidii TaxID=3376283 RepID=UPI0037BA50CE